MLYFGSDHGCAMYFPGLCTCHPLRGGKLSHYEGGTRIPFMLRWPAQIDAGLVYHMPVSLLDVLPTSLAAAGGTLPAGRVYDGVDLLPYLRGEKMGRPHETLFWRREPLFSIRSGDWKLWKCSDPSGVYGNYRLIFDLANDPNETTNLASTYSQEAAALEALIDSWTKAMVPPHWPTKNTATFNLCGQTFTLPI